jgi:hypothetical protein
MRCQCRTWALSVAARAWSSRFARRSDALPAPCNGGNTNRFQIVALLAFVILAVSNGTMTYVLMQHRTDLSRGVNRSSGPSPWWQINVFMVAQYDRYGQGLKSVILVCFALQVIAIILVIVLH